MAFKTFNLLCDECGYIEFYNEPMRRKHVGTPCPKCNANMLTEQDYLLGRIVVGLLSFFAALGLIRAVDPTKAPREGEEIVRVNSHNGKIKLSRVPYNERNERNEAVSEG